LILNFLYKEKYLFTKTKVNEIEFHQEEERAIRRAEKSIRNENLKKELEDATTEIGELKKHFCLFSVKNLCIFLYDD